MFSTSIYSSSPWDFLREVDPMSGHHIQRNHFSPHTKKFTHPEDENSHPVKRSIYRSIYCKSNFSLFVSMQTLKLYWITLFVATSRHRYILSTVTFSAWFNKSELSASCYHYVIRKIQFCLASFTKKTTKKYVENTVALSFVLTIFFTWFDISKHSLCIEVE